jgi:23S rRNA U2552 (ribose-2'-O)-methylase RlmE/FtsJ
MLDLSIKTKLRDSNDGVFHLPQFKIVTCKIADIDTYSNNFYFNIEERKLLAASKNKIDESNASKDWDKSKKISNLYELIHISNNKMKSESISIYDPLSRSFFKLWEIINYFGLLMTREPIISGHLAEGPGGFVEACLYYRQRLLKIQPLMDRYYGITLNPTSKEIPGWGKANSIIKQFKRNIEVDYGVDNTGDLYKVANIRSFSRKLKKNSAGAELITADGGFDFSVNFNKQEQLSHRLILSELLTGIKSQKMGGSFVCKLFDSYAHLTVQLLYFISCLYDEVYLVKPLTSRPANSEKYMVALSYHGFNSNLEELYYISQLENLLNQWDSINSQSLTFSSIFETPPSRFYERISLYNKISFDEQNKYVVKTLDIIKNKPSWKELEMILDEQTEKAIDWCQNYHLSINIESYFYQKYQYRKKNKEKMIEKSIINTHNNINTPNTSNTINSNVDKNQSSIEKQSKTKYQEFIEDLDKYFEIFIGYSNNNHLNNHQS